MTRGGRAWALSFSVVLLGAVLSPLARDPPRDDFPLSNYPMFSRRKDTGDVAVGHVVAIDGEGRGRPVPPRLVGSEEVMQAHETIRHAIRRGRADVLCEAVAERVAEAGPSWADAVRIEVRTDRFDALAYFDGDRKPRSGRVHARCRVGRPRP